MQGYEFPITLVEEAQYIAASSQYAKNTGGESIPSGVLFKKEIKKGRKFEQTEEDEKFVKALEAGEDVSHLLG